MSLRARLINGPTVMLVFFEIVNSILGIRYYPENINYVLIGLATQIPLFVLWQFISASQEIKSGLLILVSVAIRVALFLLVDDGPGYAISLGLLPLILYYYVQYQRTLTIEEAEDA